ncbi:MAG: hypothetical protein K2Q24_15545 [Chitinophagaceae bacterium]|nr:hypothetical protein [Chitinophagaceae bacterium]
MKPSTIILASLLIIGMNAMAQKQKTIINPGVNPKIGVAVSPTYEFSRIDKAPASFLGVRGGIVLADKLTVGGVFKTSINQIIPKSETDKSVYLHTYMFGGLLEYTLWSDKVVHLTFPLAIGAGKVEMDRLDNIRSISGQPYGEKTFFFAEPSALVEINLHKYVRLNAGAAYRFVGNMAYRNFNQTALTGLSGVIGLKFGLFKK